jgi:hypothetical protein
MTRDGRCDCPDPDGADGRAVYDRRLRLRAGAEEAVKGSVDVSAMSLANRLTVEVRVTGLRWFNIRQWAGLGLVRLGIAICGPKADVVVE